MIGKQLILYQPNLKGGIEKVITIDGEVVSEEASNTGGSGWSRAWSWFFFHGATVGGNEWEKKYKRPTDGNGREYNGNNWVYDAEHGGNRNGSESNYEAPQDYQGSVPVWDGYNGE